MQSLERTVLLKEDRCHQVLALPENVLGGVSWEQKAFRERNLPWPTLANGREFNHNRGEFCLVSDIGCPSGDSSECQGQGWGQLEA